MLVDYIPSLSTSLSLCFVDPEAALGDDDKDENEKLERSHSSQTVLATKPRRKGTERHTLHTHNSVNFPKNYRYYDIHWCTNWGTHAPTFLAPS